MSDGLSKASLCYENEMLRSELARTRKRMERKEKALTDINNHMWSTWGVKNVPFGRDQGIKIMEILNDEIESDK